MDALFCRCLLLDHSSSRIYYRIWMCVIGRERVERAEEEIQWFAWEQQSLLSAAEHQTGAWEGFINRKRRQRCVTVTVKPAAVQDVFAQFPYNPPSFVVLQQQPTWHPSLLCFILRLHQRLHVMAVSLFLLFTKYWFEGHCWNFLQTPWLWNTKECWYNYPYQVKAF